MPDPEIKDPPKSLSVIWPGGKVRYHGFLPLAPPFALVPPKPGYIYSRAEVIRKAGNDVWDLKAFPARFDDGPTNINALGMTQPIFDLIDTGDGKQEKSVRSILVGVGIEGGGMENDNTFGWELELTVIRKPSQKLVRDIAAKNTDRKTEFAADRARALKEALFKAARDRVKAANNVEHRKFEELREEERIVVYRNLIRKLLEVAGITNEDAKLRHVFAEIVQSMFDVDKMLYFVAPEWWMPRQHHFSPQNIGITSPGRVKIPGESSGFDRTSTVDWGGASRPSDYYITEDSRHARFGSSLGWLLQLDGDNLRNAFLNAPWVKAVIPIRAGHEWKALAWLESDAIEGSDGLEHSYQATDAAEKLKILTALRKHVWDDPSLTSLYATMTDPNKIRIIDAIRYLIVHIQERHARSLEPVPNPDDPTMNYLPTDEVFERGFDPLQGGFKAAGTEPFKVFDQWIEVLPTDQIVPVEVEYDPKTGMQV